MSKIKRGVSLYSYQQSQFFKELDLEGQVKEVGENLFGADGIELLDEQGLHYPNPPETFFTQWFEWMDKYGTKPIAMDVFGDVLQFRDHVMSYHESAERLIDDIHLAYRLGFKIVRTLATEPIEVMIEALPLAERLDVKIVKEIHAPIPLNGKYVREIVEYVQRTGTKHLGILPDWGIFAFRPSEVKLDWFVRQGAKRKTCELVDQLCMDNYNGKSQELNEIDLSLYSAGNVESMFHRYLKHNDAPAELIPAFQKMKALVVDNVPDYTEIDFEVMGQALLLSRTKPEDLIELLPIISHFHGKFYNMTEIPNKPGQYQDLAIDYEGPIAVLKENGWEGYINTEYEGQRNFQDRGIEDLASEIDQVRKHQEMLKRLIGE
ncbi:xylose isomerase [Listeria monocytogenes]|uniref:sugar phosphate isomerase/epimerase family protein n=1 Tax=Listeria monocytogenes TaxID=1639 RepID=UPI0010BB2EA7|nr:xylose isomerase [Listeria monocytogenes]EAC5805532.1 xylose isomerase [Listeria monocytogenes]EAC9482217.1 xylose isomerase [Listeria monocytogenes]EKC6210743.1 TIM barrel protein [Listeria monocytogenes]MDA5918469.1 sugar phosphate isomerase/epimerase [Listeria monocytogenes]HAB8285751.1 TIM barrel protein [Listeria monocytogenes]